jgi:hypothetical protein
MERGVGVGYRRGVDGRERCRATPRRTEAKQHGGDVIRHRWVMQGEGEVGE